MNNKALTIATVSVIWLIVALTLGAELSADFKTFIAKLGGHHWVGKGIVSLVFFGLVTLVFKKTPEPTNVLKNAWLVLGSAVLGSLTIFLFYIWHFLKG